MIIEYGFYVKIVIYFCAFGSKFYYKLRVAFGEEVFYCFWNIACFAMTSGMTLHDMKVVVKEGVT